MTKHSRETVLDAINGTGEFSHKGKVTSSFGNVTVIANRLGVARTTVYVYAEKWSTVKTAIKEARETLKDFTENKIASEIMGGNTTMIIFFAKTQMKDRGYVERQEVTGKDGSGIRVEYVNDWRKD